MTPVDLAFDTTNTVVLGYNVGTGESTLWINPTSAASEHRDAAVIGPLVDGVVMVVSANATRREVARRTVANLQNAGARVLGAVLTGRTYPIPGAIYRNL
jgi:hypothetical protein